jgi:hypothetical protein
MTEANVIFNKDLTRCRGGFEPHPSSTTIDRILQKLTRIDLPAKDHLECY